MKKSIPGTFIIVCLLFIIALSGILYRSSFTAYFFQDDWFTLAISRANSITDFVNFFVPRTDVIYYRPLSMQVPFFILQSLFGINPTAFHILTFLTHAANIILVFLLVNLLAKNKFVAVLTSFFYGTSTVHYIPFFWPSTYPFVLGPLMFLLSFILFLFFLERGGKYYILSIILFFLGLLTNEMVAVLPAILFFYILIFGKMKFFKYLSPFLFSAGFLFLFRFILFLPPAEGVYSLSVGGHLLSNLKTYFLWSFNWSEILTEQMVKVFVFGSNIIERYADYASLSVITFIIIFSSLVIFPAGILVYRWNKQIVKLIFIGLLWFIVGLLPVIFFPHHKFPYYLPISLVGLLMSICLMFSYFMEQVGKRISLSLIIALIIVLTIGWIAESYATIEFNLQLHWAPYRAQIARELTGKAQRIFQKSHPSFIYILATSENKYALNDQEAFRVLFQTDDIETVYTKDKEKVL